MLRTVAFVCLLAALALLLPNNADGQYMTPTGVLNVSVALTPLSNDRIFAVWGDETLDTFVFRYEFTVWSTNYDRTVVRSWCNDTTGNLCAYGYYGWYSAIAASAGFVFSSDGNGKLFRFNVTDVSTATILDIPELNGNSFQMAIDTNRNLGFVVNYVNGLIIVVDLMDMSVQSSFNYTQPIFVDVINVDAGGWAILYDSDRNILWLATDCDNPMPGQVWQYDMTDTANPVLRNRVYFAAGACFENGFVEKGTGNAWFYEDDAAMIIRFAYEDLSWGSDYWVATADYVETVQFDSTNNQAFWIDETRNGRWAGGVYRHCVYEAGSPANIHEIVNYASLSDNISPDYSFYDAAAGVLYIPDDDRTGFPHRIFTVQVATGTDCSQTPSPTSATSSSSPASTLRSMWSFLF